MDFVKEKNAPNFWTNEQREVLCVMQRWFCSRDEHGNSRDFHWKEIHSLFCAYFAEEYHSSTNTKSISPGAVVSMFHELQRKQTQIFTDVYNTPFEDPEGKYQTVKIWIRRVSCLKELNVHIREDEIELKQLNQVSKKRSCDDIPDDTTVTDYGKDDESSDSEFEQYFYPERTIKKQKAVKNSARGINGKAPTELLPADPSYNHTGSNGDRIIPYKYDPQRRYRSLTEGGMAFRCWDDTPDAPASVKRSEQIAKPVLSGIHGINSSSGFWAGAFEGNLTAPPSRNDQKRFGSSIFIHLRPLEKASKWISIWVSLISSIHRLLKTTTAHLTMIDLDYLGKLEKHEFPIVYPASTVISQYRLMNIAYPSGSQYHYNGKPEFIVWEHIPKEAILGSRSHHEFIKFLLLNPLLQTILSIGSLSEVENVTEYRKLPIAKFALEDRVIGEAIGSLLLFLQVPGRLVKRTAIIAVGDWKFINGKRYGTAEYFEGVERGYNRNGASLSNLVSQHSPSELVSLESAYLETNLSDASNENEQPLRVGDDESISDDESIVFLHSRQATKHSKKISKRFRGYKLSNSFMQRRLNIKRTIATGNSASRAELRPKISPLAISLGGHKQAANKSSVPYKTCQTSTTTLKDNTHRNARMMEPYDEILVEDSINYDNTERITTPEHSSWVVLPSSYGQNTLGNEYDLTRVTGEENGEGSTEATLEDTLTDMVLGDSEDDEIILPSIEVDDLQAPDHHNLTTHNRSGGVSVLSRRFPRVLRPALNR